MPFANPFRTPDSHHIQVKSARPSDLNGLSRLCQDVFLRTHEARALRMIVMRRQPRASLAAWREQQIVGHALLTDLPLYGQQQQRFSANAVLLSPPAVSAGADADRIRDSLLAEVRFRAMMGMIDAVVLMAPALPLPYLAHGFRDRPLLRIDGLTLSRPPMVLQLAPGCIPDVVLTATVHEAFEQTGVFEHLADPADD